MFSKKDVPPPLGISMMMMMVMMKNSQLYWTFSVYQILQDKF